jgi:hypothetical protein
LRVVQISSLERPLGGFLLGSAKQHGDDVDSGWAIGGSPTRSAVENKKRVRIQSKRRETTGYGRHSLPPLTFDQRQAALALGAGLGVLGLAFGLALAAELLAGAAAPARPRTATVVQGEPTIAPWEPMAVAVTGPQTGLDRTEVRP